MSKLVLFVALVAAAFALCGQATYFAEDFEQPFVNSGPMQLPAPPGWTQSSMTDAVWPSATPNGGLILWQRNIYNPAALAWQFPQGTTPNGAFNGTGALWVNDIFPQLNVNGWTVMMSPPINLSSANPAQLSFQYFNAEAPGAGMGLVVEVCGDAFQQWQLLPLVMNGFTGQANTWSKISFELPALCYTSQFRFRISSATMLRQPVATSNNIFIDAVRVEDWVPSHIFSVQSGDWNNPATWLGNVVPGCDDVVLVQNGHTVTVTDAAANPGIVARCRELTVDALATLDYGAGSANLLQVFGQVTAAGPINAFNGNNGRMLLCGGYTHLFAGDFSKGPAIPPAPPWPQQGLFSFVPNTAGIYMLNASYAEFHNVNHIPINNFLHLGARLVSYGKQPEVSLKFMDETTVRHTFALGQGLIDPNGCLSLGAPTAAAPQHIIVAHGELLNPPVWNNTNVSCRDYSYCAFLTENPDHRWRETGHEIEVNAGGQHQITGVLTMYSLGTLRLAYPLRIGTETTGGLRLIRGVIECEEPNVPVLACGNPGEVDGVDPGLYAEEWYHGSYICGPLRREFPPFAPGPAVLDYPLGLGSEPCGTEITSNVYKPFRLITEPAGQTVTVSIAGRPGGDAYPPLTTGMGDWSYHVVINSGLDLSPVTVVGLNGFNNSTGNSDNLAGTQEETQLAQAPTLNGTWSAVSNPLGFGPILPDTRYPVQSNAPVAPFGTTEAWFAWASTAFLVHDLAALNLTGPATAYAGIPSFFDLSIQNLGLVTEDSYSIGIFDWTSGTEISFLISDQPIAPGQVFGFPLEWTFPAPGTYSIEGRVEVDGDMDPANNTTPWLEIQVFEAPSPPPPPENVHIVYDPGIPTLVITWDANPDVSLYNVYYSFDPENGPWELLPGSPFVDPFAVDPDPGWPYKFYYVTAIAGW
ncbi:MAG: hypothetical protein LHW57_03220 [Candidatus Cloacimonetes bacterium]|nr:hypothetical protein [Candidatus Cloacimonadota bacterium]